MKYVVNIITKGQCQIWEEIISLRNNKVITYIFSKKPIKASFHIFMYEVESCEVFNSRERIALVVGEPPEIERKSGKYLDQFGAVFAPNFDYLVERNNFISAEGLLPRRAGLSMGAKNRMEKSFSELVSSKENRKINISVIQSGKKITKLQRKRIAFIDRLAKDIPKIAISGRDHKFVEDKSQILLNSQYTIAIENSVHSGYWTEKLLDPILCGVTCFYYGDPDISKRFKSPILIDINDYERSLSIIEAELKIGRRETIFIQEDQSTYIKERNIFHYIEKWVLEHKEMVGVEKMTLISVKRESASQTYLDRFSTKIRNL